MPIHVHDVLMGTIRTSVKTTPYITTTVNVSDGDEIADNVMVPSQRASAIVLAGIMILSLPLLLQRDLYTLRHASYIGFCSCAIQ
jgi:hypothetical protein